MKIAVLVSGGVDSSVVLRLLKDQGHDLTAFYLKIWLEDEMAYLGDCPWEQDLVYVREVCEQAGVSLKVVSLQKEYWNLVVAYTIAEVEAGRTPSPDLLCNQLIKFGAFFNAIDESFDKVATGHYAKIEEHEGVFFLKKAKDSFKDQTYFLSRLNQKQLSRILFPLAHLLKSEVRELANTYQLPNRNRRDSQGICFLGKINFCDFIKHHVGTKIGYLIDIDSGRKVGQHDGFWFYTIGQRKGIGLSGGPWYVASKDPEKNIVYISNNYNAPEKERNQFGVSLCNWISSNKAPLKKNLKIKIRHGEFFHEGLLDFDEETQTGKVVLCKRDQGIASGQFAVFYDGDKCLGSCVIE